MSLCESLCAMSSCVRLTSGDPRDPCRRSLSIDLNLKLLPYFTSLPPSGRFIPQWRTRFYTKQDPFVQIRVFWNDSWTVTLWTHSEPPLFLPSSRSDRPGGFRGSSDPVHCSRRVYCPNSVYQFVCSLLDIHLVLLSHSRTSGSNPITRYSPVGSLDRFNTLVG